MKNCPYCGNEMQPAADWPDDWLICLECLHVEEIKEGYDDE